MRFYGAYIKELRDVFLSDKVDQIVKPVTGTFYRGLTLANMSAAMEEYPAGKEFIWESFMSTSKNRDVALHFGNVDVEIRYRAPEGYTNQTLYTPASIREFSAFA